METISLNNSIRSKKQTLKKFKMTSAFFETLIIKQKYKQKIHYIQNKFINFQMKFNKFQEEFIWVLNLIFKNKG